MRNERNTPYFSIIVPSYNQDKYLKQNLRSIEKQSFGDFEVIIMDGGSSDGSVGTIKEFAKRNKGRVTWQSKKDGGQVRAINQGFLLARGQVVCYLNSDDMYRYNTLESVSLAFSNPMCNWVIGDCRVSKKSLNWTFLYKSLWPIERFPFLIYLLNPINQPSVFIRKDFAKRIGFFDTRYNFAFDYDFWIRCLKKAKPTRIRAVLSVFRVHPEAKGSYGFASQFDEEIAILKKHKVNKLLIYLHIVHNAVIKFCYRFLKY